MTPPDITIRGRFSFGQSFNVDIENLRLEAGRWTCLLGPSGVGKSSLLRLLAGLETGGSFEGTIETSDGEGLTDRCAYMAQSDLLAPWLDVRGNVALGNHLRGDPIDEPRREQLIRQVGLQDHVAKRPPALSGGMRQRVALARTLMEDRPVALLDEPFSSLDARTVAEMQELAFETLTGRTVLIVTHSPAEAARLGHRIYLMSANGARELPAPPSSPIRAVDDPAAMQSQIELLSIMRDTAA